MNKQNKQIVPIFYSIDDRYAPYLSVSLISLIQYATPRNQYHVIILYQKLTPKNRQLLAGLATENVQIQFVSMEAGFRNKLSHANGKLRGDYATLTIYFRLFIADLFPQYERAIYLDADTVINTDIADLFDISLQNKLVAAVPDTFAADNPTTVNYVEKGLGLPINDYFNSGVMLLDLEKLRTTRFSEHFLNLLNDYNFNVMAPDQDYLNLMCHGQVKYLSATWNAQSTAGPAVFEPKLVHYSLFYKPWHYSRVANEIYFWHFAVASPYFAAIQAEQQAYTDEQRQADEQNKQGLLTRGQAIADTGATLASIQASQRGDSHDYWGK